MQIEIGRNIAGRVCIVVDVLRASSTIVTMFERGAELVVCAADIEEARRLHERLPDHLLCGEAGGLPPEGFDYGNSPVEFSRLDLTGKSVILATTNGTRALAQIADDAAAALVGCSRNRMAVTRAALTLAAEAGVDITVVAAGDEGASDEDYVASAAIVSAARELRPNVIVGDTAEAQLAEYHSDFGTLIIETAHARTLRRLGLGEDVEYCAQVDVSHVVPILQTAEDGLLVLGAMGRS